MKILVTGKTGQLGRELARMKWPSRASLAYLGRAECDMAVPETVRATVIAMRPDLVINAAAYTAVDMAEREPELAFRVNAASPLAMAQACRETNAALIHISTDFVFDGTRSSPYAENDDPNPASVYGQSKAEGEAGIRSVLERHAIVRTSWVFSSFGTNFVKTMLRLGRERGAVRVVDDQKGGPTWAAHVAQAIQTIGQTTGAEGEKWGTYHYAGAEPVTWYEFARAIFEEAGMGDEVKTDPITARAFGAPAPRPANSVLACQRIQDVFGIGQPSWREGLKQTIAELRTEGMILG